MKGKSDMWHKGYWNGVRFGYIPDFKNDQEKKDFCDGYKYAKEEENGKT